MSTDPRCVSCDAVPQSIYDAIIHTLLHPDDVSSAINPQLRYAFKHDPKYSLLLVSSPSSGHASHVLLHGGRQVAVREQLYAVLAACHAEAGHGGRDKTGEVVRMYYSKVTKDVVQEFVRGCETCKRRDAGKGVVKRDGSEAGVGMAAPLNGRVASGADAAAARASVGGEMIRVVKRSESDLTLCQALALDSHACLNPLDAAATGTEASLARHGLPVTHAPHAARSIEIPANPLQLMVDILMDACTDFAMPGAPASLFAVGLVERGVSQEALDLVEGLTRSVRSIFLDEAAEIDCTLEKIQSPSFDAQLDASQTLLSLAYSTGTTPDAPQAHLDFASLRDGAAASSCCPAEAAGHPFSHEAGWIDWLALGAERDRALQAAAAAGAAAPAMGLNPSLVSGTAARTLRSRRQAALPPLGIPRVGSKFPWSGVGARCATVGEPLARRPRSDEPRAPPPTAPVLKQRHSMSALGGWAADGWGDGLGTGTLGSASSEEVEVSWLWNAQGMDDVPLSATAMEAALMTGASTAASSRSPATPHSAFLADHFDPSWGRQAPTLSPSFPFNTAMSAKLGALAARVGPPVDPQLQADLAFLNLLRTLSPDDGASALATYQVAKLAPLPDPTLTSTFPPDLLPWDLDALVSLPLDFSFSGFAFPALSPSGQLHVRARTHSLSGNPLNPHGLSPNLTAEEMNQAGYGAPSGARVEIDLGLVVEGGLCLERRGSATEGQYAMDVALAKGERRGPPGLRRLVSGGVANRFAPY